MLSNQNSSLRDRIEAADRRAGIDWMPPGGVARVANAKGVPGTAELAITDHDGALVLLSSYHVFLLSAPQRGPVFVVAGDESRRVGTSLYGKLGTVTQQGDYFVDCAVAAIEREGRALRSDDIDSLESVETSDAAPGMLVTKTAAGSGTTRGVIVDVARRDTAVIDGRSRPAENQIIVRSATEGAAFSAHGDSGALLRDDRGRVVGMIWGRTARGESVASHIAPVLQVLSIRLARQVGPRQLEAH